MGECVKVKYVDRIEETKKLVELFQQMKESTVFFMFSKTGVGKSSISQKFIDYMRLNNEFESVKVMTNRINKSDDTFEGQYLIQIFKTISNFFKDNKKLSFASYIKKSKNKAHKKYIFEKILAEAQNSSTIKSLMLKTPVFWIIKRVLKLNEFNCENFANDYSIQSLQLINNYIEFVLKNRRLILVVDNIQNIDQKTLQYILIPFSSAIENLVLILSGGITVSSFAFSSRPIYVYLVTLPRESVIEVSKPTLLYVKVTLRPTGSVTSVILFPSKV